MIRPSTALGGRHVFCKKDFYKSPLRPGTRPSCTADRTRSSQTGDAIAERVGTGGSARGESWNIAQGTGGAGKRAADYAPPGQRDLRARPCFGHAVYL